MLTNIIHQEWTGLTVKKHKDLKGLESQNLRDHMSEAELILQHQPNFQPGKLPKQKKQKEFNKMQQQVIKVEQQHELREMNLKAERGKKL